MKTKLYIMLAGLFLLTVQLKAQAPNGLNYQGVARNSGGTVVASQTISLRFTIHQGSSNGTSVYQETWSVMTNQFGLFSVAIGGGTVVSGNFSAINWGGNTEYLQVEMDAAGGSNYSNIGTTHFLSVPYALSAGSLSSIGTANYVPRWNSASTFNIGSIQDDSTVVGMGTAPFYNDQLLAENYTSYYGVVGVTEVNTSGSGVVGENVSTAAAGLGNGVWGFTYQSGGYGVLGENFEGTGVGIGVCGEGDNGTQTPQQYGEGVYGEGVTMGVFGYSDDATDAEAWPGYFASGDGGYVGVSEEYLSTDYKIIGTGTVSTIVKDNNNVSRIMNCPEAPEVLFEDYGTATLSNGRIHVNLDATYAKNVTINDKHPLRVLITLEGDCNGVYVTNKTTTGFDVVELKSGTSNVSFTYEVIANRADEYNDNGKLFSKNADNRFVDASGVKPSAKTIAAAKARQTPAPTTIQQQANPVIIK